MKNEIIYLKYGTGRNYHYFWFVFQMGLLVEYFYRPNVLRVTELTVLKHHAEGSRRTVHLSKTQTNVTVHYHSKLLHSHKEALVNSTTVLPS